MQKDKRQEVILKTHGKRIYISATQIRNISPYAKRRTGFSVLIPMSRIVLEKISLVIEYSFL